jgi:hypothetical protein
VRDDGGNVTGDERRVLWRGDWQRSYELCTAREPEGTVFDGVVLLPLAGDPAQVRYGVQADARWVTRLARVELGERVLLLEHDGAGRWILGGVPRPDVEGCLDVDLGVTPSTNTLPIRRLQGAGAEVAAAWVRFPELTVERLEQRYTPLGDGRWRYEAGDFAADLVVDDRGLVVTYGDDLWATVARSA